MVPGVDEQGVQVPGVGVGAPPPVQTGGAGERWRHDGPGAGCLRRALRSIVFETSVRMAAYSLLTTDLTRALSYAYAKACKGLPARR